MRVVFVNRFFHPDESATSLMLTDLVEGLADLNWERVVITGGAEYANGAGELPPGIFGVRTIRLPGLPVSNNHLGGRALNFLSFYVGFFFAGLWLFRRDDVVVCLTDPPLSNVLAHLLAILRRAHVINWVQDIYPETAARLGFGKEGGVFVRFLAWMRDRAWRNAKMNVCIGNRMKLMLADRGVPASQLTVIQNWADDTALLPFDREQNSLRKEWGFDEELIVVGYSGNLGRAHDVSTMLEASQRLLDAQDNQFLFLFIGGGAKHELIGAKLRDNLTGDANLVARGYCERSELRESLSVPDVHWMSLEPQLEGLIVPSKFYGAIAVGRPVIFIGDTDGEIAQLIAQGQCGRSFKKGDVDGVVDFLLILRSDRALRERLGSNARRLSEQHLSRLDRMKDWRSLIRTFE